MKKIKDEVVYNQFSSKQQKSHVNVVFTSTYLENKLDEILGKFGLDLSLFNILKIIDARSGKIINIKEIQQGMMHKMANTSRLIKILEDRELIERKSSKKDKRVVNVNLTEKGDIIMDQLKDLTNEFHVEQFAALSDDELDQLNVLLDKVRSV